MSQRNRGYVSLALGTVVVALTLASVASARFTSAASGGPMTVQSATLAAPTALTATATCTIGVPTATVKVNLSWTASASSFADGYQVLRSSAGGPFVAVGTVSGRTNTTFTDSTVTYSTTYSYVVRATKLNWRSVDSNTATASTKSALCL